MLRRNKTPAVVSPVVPPFQFEVVSELPENPVNGQACVLLEHNENGNFNGLIYIVVYIKDAWYQIEAANHLATLVTAYIQL